MSYITNESGDIKVSDVKGNFKWLPLPLVENRILMQRNGFTIVESPMLPEFQNANVAEPAGAKTPGKINKK